MKNQIKYFPKQLQEALILAQAIELKKPKQEIQNIHIVGLGGSGIGANFVQSFVRSVCKVPITVTKDYQVPAYVGPNTLAIASSYSGGTEETLICLEQYLKAGAHVIGISSGGLLQEKSKSEDFEFVKLPEGKPAPRACLGYSMVQQLGILHKLGFTDASFLDQVAEAATLLSNEQDQIQEKAAHIANLLEGRLPIIYACSELEPVAIRFRQQLNENSKILAWHHVIPEMNHNELVGWRTNNSNAFVIFLRNRTDFSRNQRRIEINKEIISNYAGAVMDLYSRGDSLLVQSMYLVHLVDWVSVYLADVRGVDAMEIQVIDYLKSALAASD
jgi:glucose/mannose-6-phosphate isomerase